MVRLYHSPWTLYCNIYIFELVSLEPQSLLKLPQQWCDNVMSDTITAYDVLGVSLDVSEAELRRAYRAQALKVHPDHVSGKPLPEVSPPDDWIHPSVPTIL
jgi:hypothetical protein